MFFIKDQSFCKNLMPQKNDSRVFFQLKNVFQQQFSVFLPFLCFGKFFMCRSDFPINKLKFIIQHLPFFLPPPLSSTSCVLFSSRLCLLFSFVIRINYSFIICVLLCRVKQTKFIIKLIEQSTRNNNNNKRKYLYTGVDDYFYYL